jgi:hypothetical protein
MRLSILSPKRGCIERGERADIWLMNVAGVGAIFAWVGIQPLVKAGANLWRETANFEGRVYLFMPSHE